MKLLRLLLPLWGLLAGAAQAAPVAPPTDCPRIVSQSPYLTIALEWLERGDCLVGVSRYDRRDDLPRTGGIMDPDGDAIAVLAPELIVASEHSPEASLSQAVAPGGKVLRLGGFESMAGVETMLESLAEASRAPNGNALLARFKRSWFVRAKAVNGGGRRALLLSACESTPYSFGREHVLADLFRFAGFDVVETESRIRSIAPGQPIETLAALNQTLKPEIIFTFDRATASACNAELGSLPVRVVHLSGEHFFYPGPRLIDGLDELAAKVKP
ncbi:MAG: hypothetical protein RBS40_15055 [Rhodocyclaceae bacterium]|jgi:iron complex transport system substrate-binding protein|nr:hypothetical protein [Rhodocyclaceae bacterium]MDY0014191.1 hypothetical protein [Rhodocyclaceae bacterium]